MSEQQLKELALQAQQQGFGTTERRIALSKLIDAIYSSHKIMRPYQGQFQGVYEDIYQEALQELFLYVCKNIDKYNPERGEVMTWINMLLSRRFFKEAIRKLVGRKNEIKFDNSTLENLENFTFQQEEDSDNYVLTFHKIRKYIEIDSQGIFREAHIKKYPQVNFRDIAIKRWSGISWTDISDEFNIPIPTLSSFYQRTLNKFRSKFRELCDFDNLENFIQGDNYE